VPGKVRAKTLSEKQTRSKRTRGVAQVVESFPSKQKALSSVPSAARKKKALKQLKPRCAKEESAEGSTSSLYRTQA
jgi:hypothetical protein